MASIRVGILEEWWDKIGIEQLAMKAEVCINCSACCSMSSFGLDSLPQDHIMNFIFLLYKMLAFDALFSTTLPSTCYMEFKCKHCSVRFLLLQLLLHTEWKPVASITQVSLEEKKKKIVWSDCSHFYMGKETLTLILIYLLICKYTVHTVE